MDFSFSESQAMLRDSLGRYLRDNYDFKARQAIVQSGRSGSPAVWNDLAELGLLALPFAEATGGLGGSIVDVVAVSELFGEHLLVEPYLPTLLLAGRALALAEGHAAARDWLARIIAGEAQAAFAHEEGKGTPDPRLVALAAHREDGGYELQGEKRFVFNGGAADVLVVSARRSGSPGEPTGLALLLVDPKAAGVAITLIDGLDGRGAAHIRFDGVKVAEADVLIADGHPALERLIADAILALSAEAVGAMGALLRITSEYAATRKQFGAPIGGFQVVAHRLADMKLAYAKARSTLLYTTALAEADRATGRDISVLKAQVGRLGRQIGEAAVQTHGGVGMTDELAVGHYLKRLLTIDRLFGDSEHHLRVVGRGYAQAKLASA
jgi:alkylation response protein AidB-like acyl-CoA dehydrogenase